MYTFDFYIMRGEARNIFTDWIYDVIREYVKCPEVSAKQTSKLTSVHYDVARRGNVLNATFVLSRTLTKAFFSGAN